jgi:SET domain-containing protein
MTTFKQSELIIKNSPVQGLGVFAKKAIKKDQCIEECPMILTDQRPAALADYVFGVDDNDPKLGAFVCGYGSLYNHSSEPNAKYYLDAINRKATFIAKRYIAAGEEIFITYSREWFDSRQLQIKEPALWRGWFHSKKGFLLRAFVVCSAVMLIKYWCSLQP